MKRFFYISVLMLLYILCSSKSCSDQEESGSRRGRGSTRFIKDSITAAFSSDTLTNTSIAAYEETAKLKLSDFWDYLHIVSDTGTAIEFKKQTKRIALGLFLRPKTNLQFKFREDQKVNTTCLSDFLDDESLLRQRLEKLSPDSVWVNEHLKKVNDSLFSGSMAFSLSSIAISNHKTNHAITGSVEFYSCKRAKHFGKESFMVWEVYLGDITIAEK